MLVRMIWTLQAGMKGMKYRQIHVHKGLGSLDLMRMSEILQRLCWSSIGQQLESKMPGVASELHIRLPVRTAAGLLE